MGVLLEIRSLSYTHPDGTPALNDISLQLAEGENLAVFGTNGSGKTTLLLHLNGTLAGKGGVRIRDLEISKSTLSEVRKRVGLVFQESDEQLFMPTVLEDVMFGPLNLGWPAEKAERIAGEVLARVGIGRDLFHKPPFHLSAGEKRRVAIAGVLVMEPEVLLLDEPTTSLDPPGQRALLELLLSLPQAKIIATHDANFAARLSRRAIFLDAGRLIADGNLESIVRQFDWNLYP